MGMAISRLVRMLFAKKEMRILMVGLDAAGKTTILYKLKLGEIVTTIPTIGINPQDSKVATVEYKNVSFTVWDIGEQDKKMTERISEAREELHRMLSEDELRDATLLVFANKQDLPNAITVSEITDKLGLHSLRQRRCNWQTLETDGGTSRLRVPPLTKDFMKVLIIQQYTYSRHNPTSPLSIYKVIYSQRNT